VVLIVAGHDDQYKLHDNILYATNSAYRTFTSSCVPKAYIRYLSHVNDDRRTDADGDGTSDVWGNSSSDNIRTSITSWATALSDSRTIFYLYLMDHGLIDKFLADGQGDTVSPHQLDSWLTEFETATGAQVNVLYEACHAGSFIDAPHEISKPGRVIIASTGSQNNAYASSKGAYFSDAFLTDLRQGSDLYNSFARAKDAVAATGLWQTPWLDDNGDAIADERDGDVARRRGPPICPEPGSRPPLIEQVIVPNKIVNAEGQLSAYVRDDGDDDIEVWAVAYPPSFEEPQPSTDGTIPVLNLSKVVLSDSDGDGEFVGLYEGFAESGLYHVVVYAQDAEGNQALPKVAKVQTGWWTYLPLVVGD
jgi:hypothetical protein